MAITLSANITLNTSVYMTGLTSVRNATARTATSISSASGVMGQSFRGVAKDIGGMATSFITFEKLIDFWKQSYIEAENARKESTLFESVMNNTGRAYKNATQELKDYASALEEKTGADAGDIIRTEQKLALLENLTTDLIPKATALSLDLATAMGTDLSSASTSLGKALEDPVEGLNALRKQGIYLTNEQSESIKKLAESGKIYESQLKLMEEVEKKVGGLAEKNKSALDTFKVEWKNFLEEYGQDTKLVFEEMVIPVLRQVLQLFKMITGMSGESFMSSESWDKLFGITELSKAEKKVEEAKKKLDEFDFEFLKKNTSQKNAENVKKALDNEYSSAVRNLNTLKQLEEQRNKKTKEEEKSSNPLADVEAKGAKERADAEAKRVKAEQERINKNQKDFLNRLKKNKDDFDTQERIDAEKKRLQDIADKKEYDEKYKQYYYELEDMMLEEKRKKAEEEKKIEEQKNKDLFEIKKQYFEDLMTLNKESQDNQDNLIKDGNLFQLETLKREQQFKKEELKLKKDYNEKMIREGDKFNHEEEYKNLQSSLEQLKVQKDQYVQEDIYRKEADTAFINGKQALNDTTGMLLNDWIMGEWKGLDEYGRILTEKIQMDLASMAQTNAIKALEQTAIGLAFLATGNGAGATLAFQSATAYATTAVLAGAGSFAVGSVNRSLGGKSNQEKEEKSKAVSRTTEEKKSIEGKTEQQEMLIISKNDYQKYVRNTLLPEIQKALDNGKTLKVK